jgi:hypothetical protein
VQHLEPFANVGQSHSAFGLRRKAGASIEHVHHELAIGDLGADLQPPALGLRFQAMLDRILHQSLQHHRREQRRLQALRHRNDGLEAPFHANGHDLEEGAREVHLLAKRGPAALAHLRHGGAQVADEALLHLRGARRVGQDELVDARQGVEQEMRLDLRLQRFHARLHHGPLELLGFRALGRLGRP